jgi:hypothetical protein
MSKCGGSQSGAFTQWRGIESAVPDLVVELAGSAEAQVGIGEVGAAGQGLTLVLFSVQPEPLLTPNTPNHSVIPPCTP